MTWIWNIDPYIDYIFKKEKIKGRWGGIAYISEQNMSLFILKGQFRKKVYKLFLCIRADKIVPTAKIFDGKFNFDKFLGSLKRGKDYFIFKKEVPFKEVK